MRFLSHFLLADIAASQMAEFAVCLPLLIVVVVGIFDFGEAFNVKQKLNGAAREGARFASSLPTNDLSAAGTPASVTAIRDLVASYLTNTRINNCGLGAQAATNAAPTWTYAPSGNGCFRDRGGHVVRGQRRGSARRRRGRLGRGQGICGLRCNQRSRKHQPTDLG